MMLNPAHDVYHGCEKTCTHDLARGVLIEELVKIDGPHPEPFPALTAAGLRALAWAEAQPNSQ